MCTDVHVRHGAIGVAYCLGTVAATVGAIALAALTLACALSAIAMFGAAIYLATLNPITLLLMIPVSCLILCADLSLTGNVAGATCAVASLIGLCASRMFQQFKKACCGLEIVEDNY